MNKELNEKRIIAFHTLGCKVNQYETEAMKEQFKSKGFDIAPEDSFADVYIINTCTVTNMADRKSRQFIRRALRMNPKALIAVTGCYAQTDPAEVASIEGVNLVIGNNEKHDIAHYIEERLHFAKSETSRPKGAEISAAAFDEMTEYHSSGVIHAMDSRTRAYIKIEEGCDRFCSYCIIPYARGRVRSRTRDEIVEEVRELINAGFVEIVLTGINTALYGKDTESESLETLLTAIEKIPGDFRVRLSSLEPTVVDVEDAERLLKFGKLCHHLHLSVQSGSDKILKSMNRKYTRTDYLKIVETLRRFDPLYGISTDIIVGFPGEDDDDFEDSLSITDASEYVRVHAFKYSPRRGTKAAAMDCKVDGNIKNERAKLLAKRADDVSLSFRTKCIGAETRVLFEEKTGKNMMAGYADNYVRVYADFDEECIGRLVKVKLAGIYKDGMKGEIL